MVPKKHQIIRNCKGKIYRVRNACFQLVNDDIRLFVAAFCGRVKILFTLPDGLAKNRITLSDIVYYLCFELKAPLNFRTDSFSTS